MSEASPMGAYLPVKADAHCVTRGNDHWRAAFTAEQLADALTLKVPAMTVEVSERSASGRANYLVVNGRRIGANQFQSALGNRFGWQVKSLLFDVTRVGEKFVFAGRGRGHGVGHCNPGTTPDPDAQPRISARRARGVDHSGPPAQAGSNPTGGAR